MTNGNHPEGGGDPKPTSNKPAEKRERQAKADDTEKSPAVGTRPADAPARK